MRAMASLKILLPAPRGFCAGVERAVRIVEEALIRHGPPIYVRHEIVHNRRVVDTLKAQGAVFVETLEDVPAGATVIFSAHGVPKSVEQEARNKKLFHLDATCPLVRKVHNEARQHHKAGRFVIVIGHHAHPEVLGTMGQLPTGSACLVQTVEDVKALPEIFEPVAYVTQTTLSVEETQHIIAALQRRFPQIAAPRKEDICYATTNRQDAVKKIAPRCHQLFVIGAPNSSNSLRLVEVARRAGCPQSHLIQNGAEIPWNTVVPPATIGLAAAASTPDVLIRETIHMFRQRFRVFLEEVVLRHESVSFKLPRELTA